MVRSYTIPWEQAIPSGRIVKFLHVRGNRTNSYRASRLAETDGEYLLELFNPFDVATAPSVPPRSSQSASISERELGSVCEKNRGKVYRDSYAIVVNILHST